MAENDYNPGSPEDARRVRVEGDHVILSSEQSAVTIGNAGVSDIVLNGVRLRPGERAVFHADGRVEKVD